jgi:hypothetical protein
MQYMQNADMFFSTYVRKFRLAEAWFNVYIIHTVGTVHMYVMSVIEQQLNC